MLCLQVVTLMPAKGVFGVLLCWFVLKKQSSHLVLVTLQKAFWIQRSAWVLQPLQLGFSCPCP